MNQRQTLTTHFVSGAVALSTAFAVMHPLDTLKTQLQASQGIQLSKVWNTLGRGFMISVLGAAGQV